MYTHIFSFSRKWFWNTWECVAPYFQGLFAWSATGIYVNVQAHVYKCTYSPVHLYICTPVGVTAKRKQITYIEETYLRGYWMAHILLRKTLKWKVRNPDRLNNAKHGKTIHHCLWKPLTAVDANSSLWFLLICTVSDWPNLLAFLLFVLL